MRDLVITLIVLGSLPVILARTHVGIIMWSWLSYMNPHRLTWGFAYDFPFAMLTGATTLVSLIFNRDKKTLPITGTTILWIGFIVWVTVSTIFSLIPEDAWWEWERTIKIQLFAVLTVVLMQNRQRVQALVWTIALSLGFFGIKGGIFSIMTGGSFRVWGPEGSFIEDNNALALALIMTLPLMWYLHGQMGNRWLRWGLLAAVLLTALAALTSYSRGAFLAITAMALFLWWKSRFKLWTAIVMAVAVPILLSMMPDAYFDRISTIGTYQQDSSAMGRINAWWFAYNLARDHPLTGGGFQVYDPQLFLVYAPDPLAFHDSHSIYFEVLAEHGFVGLGLFLCIGLAAFRTGSWVIRETADRAELQWARDLAAMVQVSLVGYAVGGAFLGLAYFDLYWHLVAIMVILKFIVTQPAEVGAETADADTDSAARPASHLGGSVP